MNGKQVALGLVLVGFTALQAEAVYQHGVVGVFAAALANGATQIVFVDLVIALALASVWMGADARGRGISVVPYLALTLTLGSVGVLAYLIRREAAAAPLAHAASRAG
jgi:hypothetical protein